MSEVPERIRKGAATKLGITLAEYDARIAAGDWRCSGCKAWHGPELLGSTRGYCQESRRNYDRSVQRYRQGQEYRDRLVRLLVQ